MYRWFATRALAGFVCLVAAALPDITRHRHVLHAQSSTTACPAVADTRLEQKAPTTNYASGTTLYGAGNVNGVGHLAEAAIKFDCSAIPAGSAILSATLKINVNFATADTYSVFELKRPWTETGATWNTYASGASWQVAGARAATDRGNLVLGSFTGAATGVRSIPFTTSGLSVVSGWVNGTAANNGLLLRPPLGDDDVGFHSRENSTPAVLQVIASGITYTLPLVADTRLEEKAPSTIYGSSTTLYGAGDVNDVGQLAQAALRFDVQDIPVGATIQSATLRINVNVPTVDAYELFELKKAWTESGATWTHFASGQAWEVAGAKGSTDRGSTVLGAFTGAGSGLKSIALNAAGLNVVRAWVAGTAANNGILLRAPLSNDDVGFHSSEAATPPVLEVSYNTSSQTATRFKVLHWNVHHGRQSNDTTPNIDDVADEIVDEGASFVLLNEVEYMDPNWGNFDYALALEQELEARMPGRNWSNYWSFTHATGGNAVLWLRSSGGSSPPGFEAVGPGVTYPYVNDDSYPRAMGAVTFNVGGRYTTLMTTHLACNCGVNNSAIRQAEVAELLGFDDDFADPMIVGGDFNGSPSSPEVQDMIADYFDADAGGGATSAWGARIDYIFYKRTSSQLTLIDAYVTTPLSAINGLWPSDHKPVVAIFDVQ